MTKGKEMENRVNARCKARSVKCLQYTRCSCENREQTEKVWFRAVPGLLCDDSSRMPGRSLSSGRVDACCCVFSHSSTSVAMPLDEAETYLL